MMTQYISYSISIAIISWMVGIIFSGVLRKTKYYKNLATLNLIKSKTLNNRIGLGYFKWVVKNTLFKYLNPKLKLKHKIELTELNELRKEMNGWGFECFVIKSEQINL